MSQLSRFKKYAVLTSTVFGLLGFNAYDAQAQLSTSLQDQALGEADAGRVEDRFQDEVFIPRVSPRVDVEDIILQDVPEGADKLCFDLNNLEIEGIATYNPSELRPIYADKLGKSICLDELYGIATRLTNKYRNDGFILTQVIVPPQTIEGGNAKLRVVEGYIDRIIVDGDLSESEMKIIRAYAQNIKTGRALNTENLERELLLINDLPGVEARSVLGPSPNKTGAADIRIIVERDSYDAFIGVDNHGSRFLGPLQFSAAGSLNSFFGQNERLTAQVVVAPNLSSDGNGIELAFFSLNYAQPINRLGTQFVAGFSHTDTEPGFLLKEFDVRGRSQSFNVGVTHPFVRSRNENFTGRVNFNWRDVRSSNILEPTREDRIRALRFGANYEFLDTIWRAGVNSIDVEYSQGLGIFGSSREGGADLSRAFGDPTFSKLNVNLQRLQNVTSNINVLLKAKGQLANDALLSSEEFGVGGLDIGRGFDPSEIIGDEGFAGKIEVQWDRPSQVSFINEYQLFGFFDGGRIFNKDATTSSTKTDTITSAGVGVRADFTSETQGAFAIAYPLNRDVETQGDKDPRVYFSLNRRF